MNETKAASPPEESFVTMTDVMNSINATLQSLGDDNANACFELQRRLPDGSTRKASPAEQAAADCQTRIQQASQWLASLPTRQQQYEWVELQRTYGNQLYQQQQYENAIQVYLTCLPAVVPSLQQNRVSGDNSHVEEDSFQEKEEGEHDDDNEEDRQHRLLLYCKIMNNLAQSALQLQWYKKAETFCTMALEYYHSQQPSNDETAYQEQISKLYYRRGKARRGDHFKQAKADFERALTLSTSELEQRVIQKEIRQLHQRALQAKQNQQEQKEALQKVMATVKKNSNASSSSKKQGLFVPSSSSRKAYSSLRAPSRKEDAVTSNPQQQDENVPSQQRVLCDYWDYYRGVVGRVSLFLLYMLGDDDDDERANARNKNIPIGKKLD